MGGIVLQTLKPVNERTHQDADVELLDDDELVLIQGDDTVRLDRRQRQELCRPLEEWPHYGWERVTGFGKTKQRPIRRSSNMTTLEFNEHKEFIQQRMAERGVYIADPNEEEAQ